VDFDEIVLFPYTAAPELIPAAVSQGLPGIRNSCHDGL